MLMQRGVTPLTLELTEKDVAAALRRPLLL
jgi:hypothetical protein